MSINFRRWATHDKITESSSGKLDILERSKNVDLRICEYNSGFCDILDGEFCPATFSCKPTNRSREMITFQRFYILNFKRLHEEIVQSEKSQGVIHFEAEDESLDEVCRLLQMADVLGVLAGPDLNVPGPQVEPDLQVKVLHHGTEDLHPVVLEGGVTVGGHRNFPHLACLRLLSVAPLLGWTLQHETNVGYILKTFKT